MAQDFYDFYMKNPDALFDMIERAVERRVAAGKRVTGGLWFGRLARKDGVSFDGECCPQAAFLFSCSPEAEAAAETADHPEDVVIEGLGDFIDDAYRWSFADGFDGTEYEDADGVMAYDEEGGEMKYCDLDTCPCRVGYGHGLALRQKYIDQPHPLVTITDKD